MAESVRVLEGKTDRLHGKCSRIDEDDPRFEDIRRRKALAKQCKKLRKKAKARLPEARESETLTWRLQGIILRSTNYQSLVMLPPLRHP